MNGLVRIGLTCTRWSVGFLWSRPSDGIELYGPMRFELPRLAIVYGPLCCAMFWVTAYMFALKFGHRLAIAGSTAFAQAPGVRRIVTARGVRSLAWGVGPFCDGCHVVTRFFCASSAG